MVQTIAATAQRYTFDAAFEVSRRNGENPRETVERFKAKLAVAPDRKYLLRIGDETNLQYLVVSDGYRTWAFAPAVKKYVEMEAIPATFPAHPDVVFSRGVTDSHADLGVLANLVIPILANQDSFTSVFVNMKIPGSPGDREERELPVLTALSPRNDVGAQKLTEMTIDPDDFGVARLAWSKCVQVGDESRYAFMTVVFSKFQVNRDIPASYFAFNPGNAERVEHLEIDGLDGQSILDRPAPDFQVSSKSGKPMALSSFRGHPVLLAFTAADCPSCAKQSSALETLQQELSGRGIAVLQIAEESRYVYELLRVRFVPSIVLINSEGNVVRFLAGARGADEIRLALQQAGLGASTPSQK